VYSPEYDNKVTTLSSIKQLIFGVSFTLKYF